MGLMYSPDTSVVSIVQYYIQTQDKSVSALRISLNKLFKLTSVGVGGSFHVPALPNSCELG